MKRLSMFAFVLTVAIASYGASYLQQSLAEDADVVNAQAKTDSGIRIAMLNLEEAAQRSALFREYKVDWERTQTQLKEMNSRMKDAYDAKRSEINKARMEGDEDKLLDLRVELQSLEEAMKANEQEQKGYLSKLLNQYQTDVIQWVMEKATEYAKKHHYDIVFQDYDVSEADADFFSGTAYAQSMMSKPVLITPGVIANKNAYVTDITESVVQMLQVIPSNRTPAPEPKKAEEEKQPSGG
ncbi:MAG: OmpH family outer membrane protein [Planctomycetes bacterium]|nr:OmpH family outer membrane protein [Planctomycetota bacterium]